MMTQTDSSLMFKDDKDWLEAGLCMVFLIVFPVAILALLREPRDVAPLYFVVPFGLIFAACVPFLVRRVRSARSRRISFAPASGSLEIVERTPFHRHSRTVGADDIARLEFETADNDGFWYTASVVLGDGTSIAFAQGTNRPYVRERFAALLAEVQRVNPRVLAEDTNG